MSFAEEFAENVRNARLERGLTQSTLAQQIGVSHTCVSMYETAKRLPNLKIVSIMSNVLDVSLDDLIPCASYDGLVDPSQTDIFDLIGDEDGI